MLKCDKCNQNEASVKIIKVNNNQRQEMYLCRECAAKEGSFTLTNTGFSVSDFLSSFMNYPAQQQVVDAERPELTCDKCSMTWEGFKKGSRLGCAQCYETFREKLTPIIRQVHGQLEHQGHVPPLEGIQRMQRIKKLRESLQAAIIDERYEEAAKLRDEIKLLEKES
jgi:protein arginine kinase activator